MRASCPPASSRGGEIDGAFAYFNDRQRWTTSLRYCVVNTVELRFNLTGTIPSDLIAQIDAGSIGLMFGSPDTGPGGLAPDGGATLALLGLGLVSVETVRRKVCKA